MHDVLIVGGGPAGLSAALLLGRCARDVLVVDAGQHRNRFSASMHGFLSRDGIAPADFLACCRDQLQRYPSVSFQSNRVEKICREGKEFRATLRDGGSASARILLLAMGIVDELPDVPGIADFYGRSVHHCPLCDGWEHRGQTIAVLGNGRNAAGMAAEMTLWSKDVFFCTNGSPLEAGARNLLARRGVAVEEAPIERLQGEGGHLQAVHFAGGAERACHALFFYGPQKQPSVLARSLGCRILDSQYVECGEEMNTCVPGIFVAGNTAAGLQLAIMAAAEGAKAAHAINQALMDVA